MIQVLGLVEKKNVGESKEEQQRAEAIKQSKQHQQREQPHSREMEIHPGTRPWPHPIEAKIAEEKVWFDVVPPNPISCEIAKHFPQGNGSKGNSKENE